MKKSIKAIFKGQDGSLGYKYNFDYDLWIEMVGDEIRIESVFHHPEPLPCNYSNILTFLENWDLIRKS